jgi:DtxR family transcriptional regulator, manganese transport regulator
MSANNPTRLREAKRQARNFEALREAHQREMFEDYVELIADLIDTLGEARVTDLAERLGVTPATVNSAIGRLVREGLVDKRPYRSIFLTAAGRALADASRERHRLVVDFLLALGISRETAEIDAEGIEHHISAETTEAFRRVVQEKAKGQT